MFDLLPAAWARNAALPQYAARRDNITHSLQPASRFQVQLQHLPNFPCPLLGICISVWFIGGESYDKDAQPAWRATAWEQPPWEQPPWELHADTAAGEEEGAKAKAAPKKADVSEPMAP